MSKQVLITRTFMVGVLQSALWYFDRFVELVMYPAVIMREGPFYGIGYMMIFSFFVCWFLLVVYDRLCTLDVSTFKNTRVRMLVEASSDVLGFEVFKEAANELFKKILNPSPPSSTWWSRVKRIFFEPVRKYVLAPTTKWCSKHGLERMALYFSASLLTDAMTTVIIMRPAHCHKMGLREWLLFVPSVFLSSLGWGLLTTGIISIIRHVT